ncbi:MAG TPA: hypothetical protein HPQ00_03745 [Magnetococcales bacterium]|nr:hypothetical protein [Magnetococcales bacterium]
MPLPLTPAKFTKRLTEFPGGLIIVCNILDGIDQKLLDDNYAQTLFDWWRTLVNWKGDRTPPPGISDSDLPNEIMGCFNILLYHPLPNAFRPGESRPNFFLAGIHRRLRNINNFGKFINVTDGNVFLQHVIHEDERRRLFGSVTSHFTKTPSHELSLFMGHGTISVVLRDSSTVGNPDRLLWIAPDRYNGTSLSDVFPRPDAANQLRDLLGLNHYTKGTGLVALHLPLDAVKAGVHARPTVADSGGHVRFKSRPDLPKHFKQRAWGFTVDLAKLSANADILDGWPERVVEPIPCWWFGNLTITPLGFLSETRGKIKGMDDDATYAKRLRVAHGTQKDILKRLRGYI